MSLLLQILIVAAALTLAGGLGYVLARSHFSQRIDDRSGALTDEMVRLRRQIGDAERRARKSAQELERYRRLFRRGMGRPTGRPLV